MTEQQAVDIGRRVAVYTSLQLGVARDHQTGDWGILTCLPGRNYFLTDLQTAMESLKLLREAHPFTDEDYEITKIELLSEEESAAILIIESYTVSL